MNNRKVIILVLCLAIPLLGLRGLIVSACYNYIFDNKYETMDIADYGEYIGINDEESANELINSIFPEKIEPYFDNVQYVYRAKAIDSYAFEAYLEFTIADEARFDQYVSDVTHGAQLPAFAYDTNYQNYTVADELELNGYYPADDNAGERYYIEGADIRHILINDEENRIIYVALGVYDGGGVHTAYLREFFTRFNIDPVEYAGYETMDIADYGKFIGTSDEENTSLVINSIFPTKIEPYFDNVQYVYRAEEFDSYAFEAYLEFTIADEAQFDQYVLDVTQGAQLPVFAYDRNYQAFTLSDQLTLSSYQPADSIAGERYHIDKADIRHVLINYEENRIIYYVQRVTGYRNIHTAYFCELFTRFDIDPAEYAQGKDRIAKG